MEKLFELKEFLLEKKYYVIGVIIFLLLLGSSICFCYQKLHSNEEKDFLIEKEKDTTVEKIEECYVNVDIKGEVKYPNLYQVKCDSRVNDVINIAGGITSKGDTSIINLGKQVEDEMVIVVYSKDEVKEFTNTKQEENIKIEKCVNKNTIKNDACIEINDLINSTINSNNEENQIIGDTPVKVLISINKASKEELMTLSGIGESKANSIISYRNEHGGFKSLEEIKNIKGIGNNIFDKIKDNITL